MTATKPRNISGSSLKRSLRLVRLVLKYRLDLLFTEANFSAAAFSGASSPGELSDTPRPLWFRAIARLLDICLPTPDQPVGERLRACLLELGPVYIKLGQLLSTRRDLLHADIADALATLQDDVPPIDEFDIHNFVRDTLAQEPAQVFAHINTTSLASASIAQVHEATLKDGTEVVLKVVRPDIGEQIRADMRHLQQVAGLIDRHAVDAYRLHLPRIMADHEQVLLTELNMFQEARNQIQLRRNFADSNLLYVPRVYTQFTRDNLLVMERVYGVPISDIATLQERGVDLAVLADKGVQTFFSQVFKDNFFHADMHPGNILIDTSEPSDPKYIALDCAIIGFLTDEDQNYLAQNLVAFFNRDYAEVAALHLRSGWVPADTDAVEFERVIREVCDPIFAKPLAEISFADFVVKLFRTAGTFRMEIQPQLALLQKTLLYIEGLGRQLYPQLDLWQTAQPFMQAWVAERLNPGYRLAHWLSQPEGWQTLVNAPEVAQSAQREARLLRDRVDALERSSEEGGRRLSGIAVLIMGLVLLLPLPSDSVITLFGIAGVILGLGLIIRN